MTGIWCSPVVTRRTSISYASLVAILTVAPAPGIAGPVEVANLLRSQGCREMPAVDRPLVARTRLDEAARRIASGDGLEKATSRSGYRFKDAASIRVRTTKGDEGIATILAQRFCDIVSDPDLHEIGVHQRGDETWMVLAAPFSPPDPNDAPAVSGRVLELVNEARVQARSCGRKRFPATMPLRQVAALENAAFTHAQDMAARDFLGHKGSDGSMPADRVTRANYAWSSVAENVAAGQTTPGEVVATWLASPGHCENLMSPRYSDTGIAYAVNTDGGRGVYWVQVFAAAE